MRTSVQLLVFLAGMITARLLTGCASASLDHDRIAPEVLPLFAHAKQDAIANYRAQWHAEPRIPFMTIEVADKPLNGMAGWTTGQRSVIARDYLRRNVLAHELGHQLKNYNYNGQGEDHL